MTVITERLQRRKARRWTVVYSDTDSELFTDLRTESVISNLTGWIKQRSDNPHFKIFYMKGTPSA